MNAPPTRDWWVIAGIAISATSAVVASFAGLRALAVTTGWPRPLAALLPLTVDALAMTATRVWLAASTASQRARRFARAVAVLAILLSLTGNGVWHLIAAGLFSVNWVVVVVVGAVPAGVLGLISHLAVLRGQLVDERGPTAVPAAQDTVRTPSRTASELLEEARAADAAWRRQHDGRPITRDALRQELRIGVRKASELQRQLKEERAAVK